MKNALVWNIYEKEKAEQLAMDFESAVKTGKSEKVLAYFQDTKLLRSLVVRRGENNKYFDLIEKSFNLLLEKASIDLTSNDDGLLEFLHNSDISEQVLAELENIAYHRRDKNKFFQLISIIKKFENQLENKNVLARSAHDLATWFNADGEIEKAIEENKHALELARKYEEPVIELKSKFGITYNKHKLKSRLRAEDFLNYSSELKKNGLDYDSVRAKIEAAKALCASALKQEKNQKESGLSKAKDIALEALKEAKDIQYPNAEILARKVLGEIYSELGEKRKAKSYQKGGEKLKGDFPCKNGQLLTK